MGYDIHLTRREHWFDENEPEISLQQWLEYVATDSEIQPDPENPDPENFVVTLDGVVWPLWWDRGEVTTKNPHERVIIKLVKVAQVLKARVLGDDDEIYGSDPGNPLSVERR
ncbi:hypothetical protein [Pseudorhodoferax sp. Leaf274]|uniref:hypothetical protein n=1 Tax=Pseudorhodoferax sp. Leaf274 TaxID=1736318 RepID=UPI0012E13F1E|nr:hypothetical protein [Pseudorhodoferax sp. Leaf274]